MVGKKIAHDQSIPIAIWFFVATLILVCVCDSSAGRTPYLLSSQKLWIYLGCVYPLLLVFFIYFVLVYKWAEAGRRTLFQTNFSKKELENSRYKTKQLVRFVAVLGIISAIFSLMSWGIVICGADLYSKQPFSKSYILVSLTGRGSTGVDFGLVDFVDGSRYSLKQDGFLMSAQMEWKIGSIVCAKGRTSFLGTIVEDFQAGECSSES